MEGIEEWGIGCTLCTHLQAVDAQAATPESALPWSSSQPLVCCCTHCQLAANPPAHRTALLPQGVPRGPGPRPAAQQHQWLLLR